MKQLPADFKQRFEKIAKQRTGDVTRGSGAREVDFALRTYLAQHEKEAEA